MAAPERAAQTGRETGGRVTGAWRRRRVAERYHHLAVVPSGLGATFRVRFTRRETEVTWDYDPGVVETSRDAMTMSHAESELRAALGLPGSRVPAPRPTWMGSFVWAPPLPGDTAHPGA